MRSSFLWLFFLSIGVVMPSHVSALEITKLYCEMLENPLGIEVDGKAYTCTAGGKCTRWTGPRLIESGRFFQRADVTDLVFQAADGERLAVEARFETAAWPDRLGLVLAARPGAFPERPSNAGCVRSAARERGKLPGQAPKPLSPKNHLM